MRLMTLFMIFALWAFRAAASWSSLDYPAVAPGTKIYEFFQVTKQPEIIPQKEPPENIPKEFGKVTFKLRVLISISGDVVETALIGTTKTFLDSQALKAARSYKFKPAELDGKPVPVWFNLTVKIPLKDE